MKLLWYWPYPHHAVSPVVAALVRPEDDVLLQTLGSSDTPEAGDRDLPYTVRRELPDVAGGRAAARLLHRVRRRHRRVRRFDPDVVHLDQVEYRADWLLVRRLRTTGRAAGRGPRRVSATVRNVRPHIEHMPPRIEARVLRRLYRSFDLIVVAHDVMRRQLIDTFGVRPDAVRVIAPVIVRGHEAHRAHAARNGDIVFLGPFRESSGVSVLLDAIDLLPEYGTSRFVFAGGGDARVEASVRARAAERRDVHAELMRVPPDRIDELLRHARIVVLPYGSESGPVDRLLDAYRHHVPLIVTAVGAVGEMVRADGTGWIVPPGRADALARALDEARHDDLAVARFSGAIDAALNRHDPGSVAVELRRALSAPRLV